MKYIFLTSIFLLALSQKILGQDLKEIEIADSLSTIGDFKKANTLYKQLLTKQQKNEEWRGSIEVTIKLVNNYYNQRRVNDALLLLNNTIDFYAENLTFTDSLIAILFHKKGIGLTLKKDFKSSIPFYQRAIKIRKGITKKNYPDIIKCLNNIGICYYELSEPDSATLYLEQALKLQPKAPYSSISDTYTILSRLNRDLGNFTKAEDYYLANLSVSRVLKKADWEIANEYLDFSHFYIDSEQYEKTVKITQMAIFYYERIDQKYPEDYEGIANSYNNQGFAYRKLEDYNLALGKLNLALEFGKLGWLNQKKDAFADVLLI